MIEPVSVSKAAMMLRVDLPEVFRMLAEKELPWYMHEGNVQIPYMAVLEKRKERREEWLGMGMDYETF